MFRSKITKFFIVFFIVIPLFFFSSLLLYYINKKDLPFIGIIEEVWSIGTYNVHYNGTSFTVKPSKHHSNPIITANDIQDVSDAHFVADPFLIKKDNQCFMFFEIMSSSSGDIGLAIKVDGQEWQYKGVVLDEPFHLSYPHVFQWEGKYYMIPETHQKNDIRLYVADDFPYKWRFSKTLIEGKEFLDPTICHYNDIWYLFTSIGCDNLHLYFSKDLQSVWTEHPKSPIITNNPKISRPGGNIFQIEEQLIRLPQDDSISYGHALRAFKITKLSPEKYEEYELMESPLLSGSGEGWNSSGMHHMSLQPIGPNNWLAVVDGKDKIKSPYIFIGNFRIPLGISYYKWLKLIKGILF